MLVFHSDAHHQHHSSELFSGELIESWECPERIDVAKDALLASHRFRSPGEVDRAVLESIHSPAYLEFMSSAWSRWVEEGRTAQTAMGFAWPARLTTSIVPDTIDGALGFYSLGADCGVTEFTWAAALASAGIAQSAASALVDGERAALALCRPPGHHATADQFGGYCYINNAAVAAQYLLNKGSARVGILDVDYHHGNGTQSIFYERSDVLFCSIHADPRIEFPYFWGHAAETGAGKGLGFNSNHPLPAGTKFDYWSLALDKCLHQLAEAGTEYLVVSLGVDAFEADPISTFKLVTADFMEAGRRIARLGLPTAFVMEGGYAVAAMGANVAATLEGFEQESLLN